MRSGRRRTAARGAGIFFAQGLLRRAPCVTRAATARLALPRANTRAPNDGAGALSEAPAWVSITGSTMRDNDFEIPVGYGATANGANPQVSGAAAGRCAAGGCRGRGAVGCVSSAAARNRDVG